MSDLQNDDLHQSIPDFTQLERPSLQPQYKVDYLDRSLFQVDVTAPEILLGQEIDEILRQELPLHLIAFSHHYHEHRLTHT